MASGFLKFQKVEFCYPTAPEPLFRDLTLHFTTGWTGVIGPNGTGKSTLLKLAAGLLVPDSGWVESSWKSDCGLYCQQRTDVVPGPLEEMLRATGKTANILKGRLAIENDWPFRWESLSHGERKRAQVGVALWLAPPILAIDEPFNHLDADAREMLKLALENFDGIGLLVAHHREILDSLCSQNLFINPPEVIKKNGGYSLAMNAIQEEQKARENVHKKNKEKIRKMQKELDRRKQVQQKSKKKGSKKGLHKKDHDARSKIDHARLAGRDAVAGNLQKRMESRITQFQKKLSPLVKKKYNTGIWFPDSVSSRDFLFSIPEGILEMGDEKKMRHPDLIMMPTDRIGISGPNGTGKSTLISKITASLNLPRDKVVYIPQEITSEQAIVILNEVRELPNHQMGTVMTAISRLDSRPHRLLDSENPSPGETRKLMLAIGISKAPQLIIMDEPTNHMDLPSIECLEQALSECPCGLLMVSHDDIFLQALTDTRWRITRDPLSPQASLLN
ncbi:MAG: ABC-F family ATP-binding cassette domain-containing protein [bacterium]|nr:ABC-F family ATP-binding cassette domain-containing protein [bacterium]